ncbi:MAG: hypothetical protein SYC29_03730 [Planctomycetota bacterium]|nr:hypothetical protein [Planctomycetota bacterium]
MFAVPAWGQCDQVHCLVARHSTVNGEFGESVSVDAGLIIIGEPNADDDMYGHCGAVEVVRATTGERLWRFIASDASDGDAFGASVAICGDLAIVGAAGDDEAGHEAGAAYLFDLAAGRQLRKLIAEDAEAEDRFGCSVGIDGGIAIIGAYGDHEAGALTGSAYLFDVATAQPLFKLTADDLAAGDCFGLSVSISGGLALIGAPGDDDEGHQSGSAYLFDVATGEQLAKLTAEDGALGDNLGHAVALDGSLAIVGAFGDDDAGDSSGAAYVFDVADPSHPQRLHKLVAADAAAEDEFGISVAISDDAALIGARGDDDIGDRSGAAYIVDALTGEELQKLTADDVSEEALFGHAAAMANGIAVIGAKDHGSYSFGAAYVFFCEMGLCTAEETTAVLPSGPGDEFGAATGIGDDVSVVGAPQPGDGAAYVYRFNGSNWSEAACLQPSDGNRPEWFGASVGVGNDLVVIGAPAIAGRETIGRREETGAVHVFRCEDAQWVEEARLVPAECTGGENVGCALAVAGDVLVAGADAAAGEAANSGSAYVFRFDGSTWTEEAELTAPDGEAGDRFGSAIAMSGDRVFVGAPEAAGQEPGTEAGAVYVFRRVGQEWLLEAKVTDPNGASGDAFGISVDADDDFLMVGASLADTVGADSGCACLFHLQNETWDLEVRFVPPDAADGDRLGTCVAIDGGLAAISAPRDDIGNGGDAGSIHLWHFRSPEWLLTARLQASDGGPAHLLGDHKGLALCSGTAIVGARGNERAYAFHGLGDCQGNGRSDICDIAAGVSEDLNANGLPDECESACPADFDGDHYVGAADLLILLGQWGGDGAGGGDTDDDGDVDATDLLALLGAWGECPWPPCPWDFNGDHIVDELDKQILMDHWGDCPDPPDECPWDFNGDGTVDFQDLNELLDHYGPCPE